MSVNYDKRYVGPRGAGAQGRGFYSFNQNSVTNEIYMEKEGQTAAPDRALQLDISRSRRAGGHRAQHKP
jgi:hypothetical protein